MCVRVSVCVSPCVSLHTRLVPVSDRLRNLDLARNITIVEDLNKVCYTQTSRL